MTLLERIRRHTRGPVRLTWPSVLWAIVRRGWHRAKADDPPYEQHATVSLRMSSDDCAVIGDVVYLLDESTVTTDRSKSPVPTHRVGRIVHRSGEAVTVDVCVSVSE